MPFNAEIDFYCSGTISQLLCFLLGFVLVRFVFVLIKFTNNLIGFIAIFMKVCFFECSKDYARKFYLVKKYDLVDISKTGANLQNLMTFSNSATPNYPQTVPTLSAKIFLLTSDTSANTSIDDFRYQRKKAR